MSKPGRYARGALRIEEEEGESIAYEEGESIAYVPSPAPLIIGSAVREEIRVLPPASPIVELLVLSLIHI